MADQMAQILGLIHDPRFVAFEQAREAPTIFNAVGRTYTETWHSALLGWLLDPQSSHGLGSYPLRRLLLTLLTEDKLASRPESFATLLASASFAQTLVRPNERELTEVSQPGVGRFDVFVEQITLPGWADVRILLEVKVNAKIDREQCHRYMAYIDQQLLQQEIYVIPVFVAPTGHLIKPADELLGDPRWLAVPYQTIYDEIIEPCLAHPDLSPFGAFTLHEYVKTLKYRQKGGDPLAVTKQERELVEQLWTEHESAITALYEILSQRRPDTFEPLTPAGTPTPAIQVRIDGHLLSARSISDLYRQALALLDSRGVLAQLTLPIASGSKRYLIAAEPTHQTGNSFVLPVNHKDTYFMEANKSRDGGLRDLIRLVDVCGLQLQLIGNDATTEAPV